MLGLMQSNALHQSINRAVLSTIHTHMRRRVELRGWVVRWQEVDGVEKCKHLVYTINGNLENWRMVVKQRLELRC